jgi:hypothetical protein
VSLRDVTGRQLGEALLAAGWEMAANGRGYWRLALGGEQDGGYRHMLLVPLDESAPEYEEMMGAAGTALERLLFDGRAAFAALHRLAPDVYYR